MSFHRELYPFAPGGSTNAEGRAPDYRFTIDLPPGEYTVRGYGQQGSRLFTAVQRLRVGEASGDIAIALGPATDIAGEVQGATPGMKVLLRRRNDLISADERSAGPDRNGTFKLEQVAPGDWEVGVRNIQPGTYVQSIRLAGTVFDSPVIAIPANSRGPLSIVLKADGASVTGKVEGAGARPRTVLLVRSDGYGGPGPVSLQASSGPEVNFKFESVPPGRYRTIVLEEPIPAEFVGIDAEQALGKLGPEVEVKARAALEVSPPLISRPRMMEVLQ